MAIEFNKLEGTYKEPDPETWDYKINALTPEETGEKLTHYCIGPIKTDFGEISLITTGPQGGDAGHGCFTRVVFHTPSLEDDTWQIKYSWDRDQTLKKLGLPEGPEDDVTAITVRGDWELNQIQKSFEVIANLLKKEFGEGWLP